MAGGLDGLEPAFGPEAGELHLRNDMLIRLSVEARAAPDKGAGVPRHFGILDG